MKRNILYIAIACMTLLASCKKEIKQVLSEAVEVEFGATVDESNGAKTYLDGTSVLWADGDQISVNGTAIDLVAGAGYRYGTFRGKVTPYNTNSYYVGYPASATTFNTSTGEMTVSLPTEQNYSTDKPLSGVMPMAAYVEGTGNKMTIHFHNVANVLALKLFGTAGDASKVTSIEITSSDAALTGVVANIASDGTITPCAPTGDGKTITVDCGTGVQLGTDAAHATSIYVAIPKITTATTLIVKMYCANGCYQQDVINTTASTFNSVNMIYYAAVKEVAAMDVPGALPSEFSVAEGKKVHFSQGNLQYYCSTSAPKWRFAEHQFDMADGNTSTHTTADYGENTGKWIDLFGWGTSGYHQTSPIEDTYNTNYKPYSTSTAIVNTTYNHYGYGPSTNVTPEGPSGLTQTTGNISGSYYDWGVYNTINAGGTPTTGWRTLMSAEWFYLFNTRPNASNLYGHGKVGSSCTPGMIILPDDWACPVGLTFTPGNSSWSNVYSYSEWSRMEAAGAVFLPAAGNRGETSVNYVGAIGLYWSGSCSSSDYAPLYALYLDFYSGYVDPQHDYHRSYGLSVRLVR